MARRVVDTAEVLDTAGRLLGTRGVDGVTMTAVLHEAGISSGSLYYRFPDRAALLAALWNRAIQRFHGDAYPLFEGDPVTAAIALARYTVHWCTAEPVNAQVLLAGRSRLGTEQWSPEARATEQAEAARWNAAIGDLIHRLRERTPVPTTELLLVVVDLPYASVRRYLGSRKGIPPDLADVVAGTIARALTRPDAEQAPRDNSGG